MIEKNYKKIKKQRKQKIDFKVQNFGEGTIITNEIMIDGQSHFNSS